LISEKEKVEVEILGHEKIRELKSGTSLMELKNMLNLKEDPLVPIVAALYNGKIMGLEYRIRRDCRIKFITTASEEGQDIYRKSLSVLLHAAFIYIMGQKAVLKIEHSLNKGFFYSYINKKPLTEKKVKEIEKRMKEMVDLDIPLHKLECEAEDARELFTQKEMWDRYYLAKYTDRSKVILYILGECINLAQGPLVPSTGYLKLFSVEYYPPGLILKFPVLENPRALPAPVEQKKLFNIYSEQREWSKILDVDSAGKLNRLIIKGKIEELIWVLEGLHEKKIAYIADVIRKNIKKKRIILLAGPSSSGKTTFAKRLTIQLLANGINPAVISLDNYYLPRNHIPLNEEGKPDLERLEALDVELINRHLTLLLKGEKISVPRFDFKTGKIIQDAFEVKIGKNQIVIVEGIHGMNEALTSLISKEVKMKVYISALTQLNIDYVNRIPTSTIRLIRRIVRDNQFRAYTASQTIKTWPMVRRGEERNIFPFQEEADIMFNSSLVYEMSVLKGYVEPLLKDVDETDEAFTQAKRLLHFTSNFLHITPEKVPLTSILREFIGGSGFKY